MLSAKWKQGASVAGVNIGEPLRAGQVRSFRISTLDAAAKRIQVEVV